MSKLYIFYFIISFKPSLTLLYWDIQQFVFLSWIHLNNLFSHICKRLRPRWLTGFRMCLCCVRDNYLSVNCSTQSLLLRSSSWWFKAFHFSTFRFSMKLMKLIHLEYNWQQNRAEKRVTSSNLLNLNFQHGVRI